MRGVDIFAFRGRSRRASHAGGRLETKSRGRDPASRSGAPSPAALLARLTRLSGVRIAAFGAAIGLMLSVSGAFGSQDTPFVQRTAAFVAIAAMLGLLGYVVSYWLDLLSLFEGRRGWRVAAVAAIFSVLTTGLSWAMGSLFGGAPKPLSSLPTTFLISTVISVTVTVLGHLLVRNPPPSAAEGAAPVKFLERLPLKLRGARLWAVEAQDHYLRLHTSLGQDLILMRLADAIAELEGIEGARVHRSWWVAREALADAERGDGRATLTLKDGVRIPVSRTYARDLRERGWF